MRQHVSARERAEISDSPEESDVEKPNRKCMHITSTSTDDTRTEAFHSSEAENGSSEASPACLLQHSRPTTGITKSAFGFTQNVDDAIRESVEPRGGSVSTDVTRSGTSPPPKRKRLSQVALLHGCRSTAPATYVQVAASQMYSDLDLCQQAEENSMVVVAVNNTASKARQVAAPSALPLPNTLQPKYKLLHNVAMVLTFVAIVSLWGVVDVAVEVASGISSGHQFQLYAMLLFVGAMAAMALRRLKALSYRWTSYPALLASLLTAAAAWGLVDVAIEAAAGGDQARRLLYYFFGFLVAGFLVAMHVFLVDRGFSKVVESFI